MTVPKVLGKKVEVSHVHTEYQRSLLIEEKELFLGWKSTVLYRERFPHLCKFFSTVLTLHQPHQTFYKHLSVNKHTYPAKMDIFNGVNGKLDEPGYIKSSLLKELVNMRSY